ncbi:MAG: NifU family protein [Candidatus Liberibacter europaeus]|uniref:NifU family protein n=1 Tax=Candidatus Liberibacter europaeus TaxID=744859 RepID=A0A2T4VYU7_9HYPH|nr:NifU family protein [Candidatus Liberibacter europaeus]PTL86933.1 MAG: NifU family protein [Candidatus Liberibacter europaeus]
MFIQTESTPNPDTMKFIPGRVVLPNGTVHFSNADESVISPLASRIFAVSGVSSVYLGYDFITVAKKKCDWSNLRPPILGVIMEHFISGDPVITDGYSVEDGVKNDVEDCGFATIDSVVVTRIKDILDKHVRPAVAKDGGDIVFKGYKDGIVFLTMMGSCSGCPSATSTIKYGVMNLLNHFVPEVNDIRIV